jgi:chemotaxis protein MotB
MNSHTKVIIRRIKDNQSEHHGGMWKVAYADFITALMAFFLLLWVLNSTPKENLKGVAQYFNPVSLKERGIGLNGGESRNKVKGILSEEDLGGLFSETDKTIFLNLISSIRNDPNMEDFSKNLEIDVTNDGLRVQIVDSDERPMFKPNTSEIQLYMVKMLTEIGKLISPLPNNVSIIGHTASVKNIGNQNLDLWKLSVDRAIQVKDFLSKNIRQNQIISVAGKADTEHLDKSEPYNSKNIRISLIILKSDYLKSYSKSLTH